MSPGTRIEAPIRDEVERLAFDHPHWTPTQILAAVTRAHGDQPVVSLRTVQRLVGEVHKVPVNDEPWTIANGEPEDLALVLPVVRYLWEEHASDPYREVVPIRRPSRLQAVWIVRLRRAFPDLTDLGLVFHFAARANRGGTFLDTLERFLAYAPWRDGGAALGGAYADGIVGMDVVGLAGYGPGGYTHAANMAQFARRGEKGASDEQR